jgi:phosphoglucomutase
MIRFGTNGWRGIMGEEFTFRNVRIVTQAIANWLIKRFSESPITIIVGYDTRFLSERFAFEAAKVLSHNQIHVYFSDRDCPSQALAYQIIKRGAQGGINFTASFNPPEYNGLKFNLETGAPALPAQTEEIEQEIGRLVGEFKFCPYYPKSEYIERISFQSDYLDYIQNQIDFDLIRKAKIKVAVDPLYGTSREYLDEIFEENRIPVEEIHGYIDPYFGGIAPSCNEANLAELKQFVQDKKCHFGVATDGDGDRFGIVSEKGEFIEQNVILALLFDYLVRQKGWRRGVARSVATTHLIDRIARRHEIPLHKTPVGFKYIADLFLKAKIDFGGEESASLSIRDHIPEKDGIIAGLLVAEMMAYSGKKLSEQKQDLYKEYGTRSGYAATFLLNADREKRLRRLSKYPPSRLGERNVTNIERIDGVKFDFEHDDWLLMRFSGTEPIIRIYGEAETQPEMDRLVKSLLELLK